MLKCSGNTCETKKEEEKNIICGFFIIGYEGEEQKYIENMINWKKTHGVTPVIVSDSRLKGDGDKWQTLAKENKFGYLDLYTYVEEMPILQWYIDNTVSTNRSIRITSYTDICRWYILKKLRDENPNATAIMLCQPTYLTSEEPWLNDLLKKNNEKIIIIGKDRGVIIEKDRREVIELITIAYNQLYTMLWHKGWLEKTNDQFSHVLFKTVATKEREITLDDLKETYGKRIIVSEEKVKDMLSGKNGQSPIFWDDVSDMQNALSNYNPLGPEHNDVFDSFEIERRYEEEVGYGNNEDAVVYRMPKTDSHWSKN